MFRLGKAPRFHQTDNSTAATHAVGATDREFNARYLALMRHLKMTPRTIGVGKSNQNGDVESLNGVLKRRLNQHLLLRGSREFASVEAYRQWLESVIRQANAHRQDKLEEELKKMHPVTVERLAAFVEETYPVSDRSTIRVKRNTYSVPSRLIGERVKVRIFDDRIEVWHGQRHQLSIDRLLGVGGHRIDYRHIIWSLVRKPGAFERYQWRDALFPSLIFRRAYDALCEKIPARKADIEYLRILHLAASTMECEVEAALEMVLEAGALSCCDDVRALVAPQKPTVPSMPAPTVDLESFDALLSQEVCR